MPVGPAEKEAPCTEDLDPRQALALWCALGGRRSGRADLARTRTPEVPEGQDAVVSVPPDDAERITPYLGQLLDVGRVRRTR